MRKKTHIQLRTNFLLLLIKYLTVAFLLLLVLATLIHICRLLLVPAEKQIIHRKHLLTETIIITDLSYGNEKKHVTKAVNVASTPVTTMSRSVESSQPQTNNKDNEDENDEKDYESVKTSNLLNCPDDSDLNTLKGPINITAVLDEFNLTGLVQLHEFQSFHLWKNKYVKPVYHYYLDKRNLQQPVDKKPLRFDEFWQLWNTENMSLVNLSRELLGKDGERVELGGSWRPKGCESQHKLVVIVPYRDRLPHLRVNLQYLHSILQKQMSEYRIVVVEGRYSEKTPFNKGRIYNAGKYFLLLVLNLICFA
jgi:hypothetical protein